MSRPGLDLVVVLERSRLLLKELGDPGVHRGVERVAPFLRVLGALAHAEGLRWGGDWHGQPSAWDTYGLGWDPAHLETGACR